MISKKHILWTFLTFVALAMITGIAAVVLPNGWIDDEVLITIFIVGAYSLGGILILGAAPKHGQLFWTLRICAASLALSMSIFIAFVWLDSVLNYRWSPYFYKPGSIFLIIGCAAAHRLIIVPLKVPLLAFRIIKRTALISAMILVAIVTFGIIFDGFGSLDELFVRLMAIASIFVAGATIAAGAIAIFAPKPGEDEQGTLSASIPISLQCPRCDCTINAHSNKDARCPTCKLKVRIQIEEPRCLCGYLLYQLNTDTCPECGKPIPESEQWGSTLSPPPS